MVKGRSVPVSWMCGSEFHHAREVVEAEGGVDGFAFVGCLEIDLAAAS